MSRYIPQNLHFRDQIQAITPRHPLLNAFPVHPSAAVLVVSWRIGHRRQEGDGTAGSCLALVRDELDSEVFREYQLLEKPIDSKQPSPEIRINYANDIT